MPVTQLDDLFDHGGDVLGTTQDASGVILAQTGDAIAGEVASNNVEVWAPWGLASRPAKAVQGKGACQALTLSRGSADIIFGTRDVRGSSLYGALGDGETCLYAPGPNNSGTSRLRLLNDGSSTTAELEAALVKLGAGAVDGAVVGGADFLAWAAALVAKVNALAVAVATTPAVQGSALDPSVAGTVDAFPSSQISTVVKAAT